MTQDLTDCSILLACSEHSGISKVPYGEWLPNGNLRLLYRCDAEAPPARGCQAGCGAFHVFSIFSIFIFYFSFFRSL
jgi:hypothetical protein